MAAAAARGGARTARGNDPAVAPRSAPKDLSMGNPVTLLHFGQLFDQALAQYVVNALGILIGWLTPVAVTLVTIWVLLYGYATVRNETGDSVAGFAGQALRISLILGVALTSNVYMSWVVGGANALLDALAGLFLQAGGLSTATANATAAGGAWALVDQYDAQVETLVVLLGKDVLQIAPPFVNFPNLFAIVLIAVGGCFFEVCVLAVTCFAKIILTLALSIGPLFILGLMFTATRRFFEAWLSKLLSAVMLSSITYFLAGLSLSITGGFLTSFIGQIGTLNFISAAMVVGVIELLLGIVMIQAPTLAAALTGGAAFQSGVGPISALLAGRGLGRGSPSGAARASGGAGTGSGRPTPGFATGPSPAAAGRGAAAGGPIRRAAYKLASLRSRS
jgi:type IV secretion system protein VirB6